MPRVPASTCCPRPAPARPNGEVRAESAGSLRRGTGVVRGVLGVIRRNGRLLMIQRAADVRAGGLWCFPGGAIEDREREPDALVRELHEELSVRVVPLGRRLVLLKHGGRLVLYVWTARLRSGRLRPNPREVAAVRWMCPAEIRRLPVTARSRPPERRPHVISGTRLILRALGL